MKTKQTILTVDGMSCPSCVEHVREALAIDGVTAVSVELDAGTVEVTHDVRVSPGRLVAVLEAAGYPLRTTTSKAGGCCGG